MKAPFVRSAYNYDRSQASKSAGLFFDEMSEPSLTVQSQKDEADINVLVKRFGVTGHLPQSVRAPSFGDFTGVNDFQSAMNAIREAQESFDAMPADVRARFHNDPQEFVEFCSDEENIDEMRKMGLTKPEDIANVTDVRIVGSETPVFDDTRGVDDGDEEPVVERKVDVRAGARQGETASRVKDRVPK